MHVEPVEVPDIDLTHPTLPEGKYDALIDCITLKLYSTVILCIRYRVPYLGRDFTCGKNCRSMRQSVPQDMRAPFRARVGSSRIFSAYGEQPPPSIKAPDLEDALVGREVHISTRNRQTGTFAVPMVSAVLGRARNPVPPPIE